MHTGTPTAAYPLPWAVYRWIDGDEVRTDNVHDWATFGSDLVAVVVELHRADLVGAHPDRRAELYRGGSLAATGEWIGRCLAECET